MSARQKAIAVSTLEASTLEFHKRLLEEKLGRSLTWGTFLLLVVPVGVVSFLGSDNRKRTKLVQQKGD